MAVAGLLGSAERQVGFRANGWSVHVDDAGIDIAHRGEGLIHVFGVDRSGEAVRNAVGDFDGFGKIVDRDQRNDWAKNFLLGDTHFRRAIAEQSWLVEPALGVRPGIQTISAGQQFCAFVLANLYVRHHGLELFFIDARAHFDLRVEAVTNFQMLHALDDSLYEFAIHAFVDRNAAGCSAALSSGAETTPYRAVHGQIEIRVIHHYDDVLAAHFQRDVLKIWCAGLRDDSSHRSRAGEAHDWNLLVGGERSAGARAVAADQIHHAAR